jgi:hypothetical protein
MKMKKRKNKLRSSYTATNIAPKQTSAFQTEKDEIQLAMPSLVAA